MVILENRKMQMSGAPTWATTPPLQTRASSELVAEVFATISSPLVDAVWQTAGVNFGTIVSSPKHCPSATSHSPLAHCEPAVHGMHS
jgi:hypothetical protein